MTNFEATRTWLAEAAGMREPSTLERLQRVDWREYAPTRRQTSAYQPYVDALDATNLIAGLVVGVGIGIAIGYALKGNVAPTVSRVRERARDAASKLEERLPESLRVTRMEETEARTR